MLLDMLPELKDATDMVDVFAYYLGFSGKKPQFKRFNYAEKMEYWALVWGTFVMALTGLTAWFKVISADARSALGIDVAITVHFYEAILATLAIIVWHFYQVILDPDTYPVNFAFLDGKMSVEHYQEEHGLDSATLSQYAGAAGDEVKTHHVTASSAALQRQQTSQRSAAALPALIYAKQDSNAALLLQETRMTDSGPNRPTPPQNEVVFLQVSAA